MEKEKLIIELEKAKKEHAKKQNNLNDKKRTLVTQAEHMKSPNNTTDIPDVLFFLFRQWPMSSKSESKRSLFTKRKIYSGNYL